MTINLQRASSWLTGGFSPMGGGLKSTQEKLERQAKCQSQVDFFENQKENLKEMKCDTVEEIARKLELFHSYEDQIAAAKAAYNSEQMWHTLDEAREQGEKIAEAVEETAPKTPEERKEEQIEEATGVEKDDGLLEEALDAVEELTEELTKELTKELEEELNPESMKELTEKLEEEVTKELKPESTEAIGEKRTEAENERTSESVEALTEKLAEEAAQIQPEEKRVEELQLQRIRAEAAALYREEKISFGVDIRV